MAQLPPSLPREHKRAAVSGSSLSGSLKCARNQVTVSESIPHIVEAEKA